MTQKSELGKLGEDIACKYLVDKGYKIVERNFQRPWGEIDAVAKYKDGTLVFVEVKTSTRIAHYECAHANKEWERIQPEDQLTQAKLRKLQKTASLYAGHHKEKIKDDKGWRIDLIAITFEANPNIKSHYDIKHYENI